MFLSHFVNPPAADVSGPDAFFSRGFSVANRNRSRPRSCYFEDEDEDENDYEHEERKDVLPLPSTTLTLTICSIRASEFWRRVHG
jgi:hypothetical protein